jgi:hypothetical protein
MGIVILSLIGDYSTSLYSINHTVFVMVKCCVGLRQSDALSCMLFNNSLVKAMRIAGLDITGTILHKSIQILAYVDDIVIIERYERAIKEAFIQLETATRQMGLMINYDKTKYVELSNNPIRENCITMNNHNIEKVMEFKYVASLICNNNNSISVEINHITTLHSHSPGG